MRARGLRSFLSVALVLGATAWVADADGREGHGAGDRAAVEAAHASVATAPVATRPKRRFECEGVSHRQVRGREPTYTRKKLVEHRNKKRVCRALWIPKPRKRFVPQGLAVAGSTAWMTGFLFRDGYGKRPCRLMKVHLRNGRLLRYHGVVGRVGPRPMTYCRHGGGVIQRGKWLWIVEKNRLWLVDSTRQGRTIRATRVWRLKSPVRGSTILGASKQLGIVPFQESGRPRVHWFPVRKLLRKGVLDLATRGRGRKQVGAARSTRIPTHVQGATIGPNGRLYLSRSNLACGELVTPGRRIALVPGAEGVDFYGRRLWVASESGARPYAAGTRKPLTAGITGFEWPGLDRARRSTCRF